MPSGLPVEPGCIKDGIAGEYCLPVRFNVHTENIWVGPGKACDAAENLSFVFNTDIFLPVGRHARGNLRKNPVRRLINLAWPLLKKTFQSADDLSLAMQARCYSENRTDPRFFPNGKEGWVMGLALVFSAGMLLTG